MPTPLLFSIGALIVDPQQRQLKGPGGSVSLTRMEARTLTHLWRRQGAVVSHRELLTEVWEYAPSVDSRAPHHTITRLRRKLGDQPDEVGIFSVWGKGYRLQGAQALEPATLHTKPAPPQAGRPLFGRGDAVAATLEGLDTSPLVTVTGPGGIGKTSLAAHIAAEHSARFPGGVFWVSLVEAQNTPQITAAVAAAMGVGPRALAERLWSLRGALVVLDNTEHIADAVGALLPGWLARAEGIRWLVTSRCSLRLREEQRLVLEPLSPGPALEMFVERAHRAHARFTLTPQIQDGVPGLEGVPLAIELAAGNIGAMLGTVVPTRSRHRDTPERHTSLRSVLSQSWARLAPAQQHALATLSVFAGAFTPAAACAVLGEADGLLLLTELEERSWLQARDGRLRMLAHVRAFARSHHSPGSAQQAGERHARHFAARGDRDHTESLGPDAVRQLRQELAAEHTDLLAAVQFSLTHGRFGLAARSWLAAHALLRHEQVHLEREPLDLLLSTPTLAPLLRARLLSVRADWHRLSGSPRHGAEDNRAAMQIFAEAGEAHAAAVEQCSLGGCLCFLGEHRRAQEHIEQSRAVFDAHRDRQRQARALLNLATLQLDQGAAAEAERLYRDAHRLASDVGDRHLEGKALTGLGFLHRQQGATELAEAYLLRALDISNALNDPRATLALLNSLGNLSNARGDSETARARYREALALAEACDDRMHQVMLLGNTGELWEAEGNLPAALACYEAALNRSRGQQAPWTEGVACSRLGALLCASGARCAGLALLDEADTFASHLDPVQRGAHLCRRAEHASTPREQAQHLAAARAVARRAQMGDDTPLGQEILRVSVLVAT